MESGQGYDIPISRAREMQVVNVEMDQIKIVLLIENTLDQEIRWCANASIQL